MAAAAWMIATQVVGVGHLAIAGGNLVVARALDCGRLVRTADPWLRQVFIVHAAYVIGVLTVIGVACVALPADVATTRLGRCACGALTAFWAVRLGLQAWYFDRELLRRLRIASVALVMLAAGFVALFAALAAGVACAS